jgi:hypothetical protein
MELLADLAVNLDPLNAGGHGLGAGQLTPNALEVAVLRRLADLTPSIRPFVEHLHVLSREYTGVGSYTKFVCAAADDGTRGVPLSLNAFISIPTVQNGMGAALWCRSGQPECLELFTFGNDHWDGTTDGFSINPS